MGRNHFHLHLISDSTGETLIAISRAITAQYQGVFSIDHVYPLIRNQSQLDRIILEIEASPGIVLFTLVDSNLATRLSLACQELHCPCLSVLQPVFNLFQSYLGETSVPRPGAQHMLNADYFKRIDALNFSLMNDDGQLHNRLEDAEVILLGVSRTSKTPTSIYLANRGIKTANVPLVPNVAIPEEIKTLKKPLIVGLIASPDRIIQIRQNRLLSLNADSESAYVEKSAVIEEIAQSRKLFEQHNWPIIDVTRRSIEETAANIIDLYRAHRLLTIANG